jgi:hypothetical protein
MSVESRVIPSPNRAKEWEKFWTTYKAQEKATAAFQVALQRIEQETPQAKRRKRRLAVVENHVPYVESISTPLIETLNHSAGLPANQLAGHAANVDFWINEAQHCLAVIDGYQNRFDRLRAAQTEYEKQQCIPSNAPPLRRGTQDHKRQELRRALCDAIERFLTRCRDDNLLSERNLHSALRSLGI